MFNQNKLTSFVLINSALIGVNFALGSSIIATETPTDEEVKSAISEHLPQGGASIEEIGITVSNSDPEPMEQITSVSQLKDVEPTDWAFTALQSLVERYGCLEEYPDGTFQGNRTLTRDEFAAGLNACLEQINLLIQSANQVTEDDLTVVQRLSEEFAAELVTLESRIDALDSRTGALESNQFSTTTKFDVLAYFNVVGAAATGDVKVERIDPDNPFSGSDRDTESKPIVTKVSDNPNTTFSQVVLIGLNTSFTGKDLLKTSILVGNGQSPANNFVSAGLYNTTGVPVTDLSAPGDVFLLEAYYRFPLSDSAQLAVGPQMLFINFFDLNAFTSPFGQGASSFNSSGSSIAFGLKRSGGAVFLWQLSEQLKFNIGYLSTTFDPANSNRGIFNGNNSITAELTYSPSTNFNVRLLYDRSNLKAINGLIDFLPIRGVIDDGFGGDLNNATTDMVNLNFDWLVTPGLGLFGRYTYATTQIHPQSFDVAAGRLNAQSFQIGLAFPELLSQGDLATLSLVMPYDVLKGRKYLVSGGGNGGTQFDIEASYFLPLSANIFLIPSFYVILNPNNFSDNPTIFVPSLRTEFFF